MDNRTLEEQLAHCDGKDCTCCAYGKCDCGCEADWTPAEIYRLRAQLQTERGKLESADAAHNAVASELAAYKHVMDILRDSPCKYPPWRDAREVVEWIERSVAVRLAANA